MHIEIQIQRPLLTLGIIAALTGGAAWVSVTTADRIEASRGTAPQEQAGGDATAPATRVKRAEEDVSALMSERAVRQSRITVLRAQLAGLAEERRLHGDEMTPVQEEELRQATVRLTGYLKDEKEAEEILLASYHQIWDAQKRVQLLSREPGEPARGALRLQWPVDPAGGISTPFMDPEYKRRFPFMPDHDAIDIRVMQGTSVYAALDGEVTDVVDNGLGFNYVTIRSAGGAVTLYGHLSTMAVEEGDEVEKGDVIGESGGMPGTPGAGFSTGPHLHFKLVVKGVSVDPLEYLPEIPEPGN